MEEIKVTSPMPMKELLLEFLVATSLGFAIGSAIGAIVSIFVKGQFWNVTLTIIGLILLFSAVTTVTKSYQTAKKHGIKVSGLIILEVVPLALGLTVLWFWPITNWFLQ